MRIARDAAPVGIEPVGLCKEYSQDFPDQVADELETLPEEAATTIAIGDYSIAREVNC